MIEKLTKIDESDYPYRCPNDIAYQSKSNYLQNSILGLCGCGNPKDTMKYVYDNLKKIQARDFQEGDPWLFFLYWADKEEYTEHGSSVYGGWLTPKGEELLRDIEWCLENEKEED